MRKVKKDLAKKKHPVAHKNVENNKQAKVEDLAPKAKNLAKNIKDNSQGMKKSRKAGDVQKMDINPKLQKVKPKKK
jgi:hypothetical protein